MTREDDKFQDLQGESQKETRETQKAIRLKTQEEPVFEFESKGRKKLLFQFKGRRNPHLLVRGSDFLLLC